MWAASHQTLDFSGGQGECHVAHAGPVPRASSLRVAKDGIPRALHTPLPVGLAVDSRFLPLTGNPLPSCGQLTRALGSETWLLSSSLQTLGTGENKNEPERAWAVEARSGVLSQQ